jgi:hypothetical protein
MCARIAMRFSLRAAHREEVAAARLSHAAGRGRGAMRGRDATRDQRETRGSGVMRGAGCDARAPGVMRGVRRDAQERCERPGATRGAGRDARGRARREGSGAARKRGRVEVLAGVSRWRPATSLNASTGASRRKIRRNAGFARSSWRSSITDRGRLNRCCEIVSLHPVDRLGVAAILRALPSERRFRDFFVH